MVTIYIYRYWDNLLVKKLTKETEQECENEAETYITNKNDYFATFKKLVD